MTVGLSPGKIRGLDRLATPAGVFAVLAIDHRDSLRAVLPDGGTDELVSFKLDLLRGVGDAASGAMLEPELSLPQALTSGALHRSVGFMAALEAQGYLQDPWAGPTIMLDGWSAAKAAALGANAAKILLAYDPDRSAHAAEQRAVVADAAAVCADLDLALLVEPVCFGMAPHERADKVRRSAEELTGRGIDVLKVEFPGDPGAPDGWADACRAVTEAASEPWVLLSSGVTWDQYREQLAVAFDAGCSGFTGGRAVWRPLVEAAPEDRHAVASSQVRARVDELRALAEKTARPWRVAAGLVD